MSSRTSSSYNAAASRSGTKWPQVSSSVNRTPNAGMGFGTMNRMSTMGTFGVSRVDEFVLDASHMLQQHSSVGSSQPIGIESLRPLASATMFPMHENVQPVSTLSHSSTFRSSSGGCRPLTVFVVATIIIALLTITVALPMTSSWTQSRSAFVASTIVQSLRAFDNSNHTLNTSDEDSVRDVRHVSPTPQANGLMASEVPLNADMATSFVGESTIIGDSGNSKRPSITSTTTHQLAEEVMVGVTGKSVCEELLNVVRFRTGISDVRFIKSLLPMHLMPPLDHPVLISASGMVSPYFSHFRLANLTAVAMYRSLNDCARSIKSLSDVKVRNMTCPSPGVSFRIICSQEETQQTVECALRATSGCVSSAQARVQSSALYNRLRSDWILWCTVTTLM